VAVRVPDDAVLYDHSVMPGGRAPNEKGTSAIIAARDFIFRL
jgi:hypothetical protein